MSQIYYTREAAARLLNLSKSRIGQLHAAGQTPPPDATLSTGAPLWLKATLIAWALRRSKGQP